MNRPKSSMTGADIVLTWADTVENLESIEAGAFRVFGDTLVGGNA